MIKKHKERNFSYIYKITNIITGKIYVGQRRSDKPPNKDSSYLGSGKIILRSIKSMVEKISKKRLLKYVNFLS